MKPIFALLIQKKHNYDQFKREKLFNTTCKLELDKHLQRSIKCIYDEIIIQIMTDELSSEKPIYRGVCQGCPMSCALFNLYFDMIEEGLTQKPLGLTINDGRIIEVEYSSHHCTDFIWYLYPNSEIFSVLRFLSPQKDYVQFCCLMGYAAAWEKSRRELR